MDGPLGHSIIFQLSLSLRCLELNGKGFNGMQFIRKQMCNSKHNRIPYNKILPAHSGARKWKFLIFSLNVLTFLWIASGATLPILTRPLCWNKN